MMMMMVMNPRTNILHPPKFTMQVADRNSLPRLQMWPEFFHLPCNSLGGTIGTDDQDDHQSCSRPICQSGLRSTVIIIVSKCDSTALTMLRNLEWGGKDLEGNAYSEARRQ